MRNLLRSHISLTRMVIINFFTVIVGAVFYYVVPVFEFSVVLFFFFVLNLVSFFLAVRPATRYSGKKHSFIGRKRILIALMCIGSIALTTSCAFRLISLPVFLTMLAIWTVFLRGLHKYCDEITALLHKMLGHHHSIGIIGTNEKSLRMVNHLHLKNKFTSIKYLNDYGLGVDKQHSNNTTSIYSFVDFTKEKGLKELYISTSPEYKLNVKEFIQEAERHCIRVKIIDLEPDPEIPVRHIKYINGLPIWQQYNEPLRRTINQITKRAFDIVVSSLVIFFILSWLIPLIGLLIKLDNRGPVFFKQLRSGRDNRPFVCLKFRSMRVNAESDVKQATFKDSRITKIGAFLRKTSLDEFPQFINVFRGEMSIVGPRPHMLRHTEEYSRQIKQYMGRLYLKPGLTGWAQVNGYRGETVNLMMMEKRVEYDIDYMENWSLWFDIKIMALTFWNILIGEENAY